jgi:hypothetical protein
VVAVVDLEILVVVELVELAVVEQGHPQADRQEQPEQLILEVVAAVKLEVALLQEQVVQEL